MSQGEQLLPGRWERALFSAGAQGSRDSQQESSGVLLEPTGIQRWLWEELLGKIWGRERCASRLGGKNELFHLEIVRRFPKRL